MPRKTNNSRNTILKLPEQPKPIHKRPPSLCADTITIALVGCGGNGAQMLTKLARLDHALRECGRHGLMVHVFDPDTVSRSNIGRQLFAPSDIGVHKSVVLVNRLNAFYGLNWEAYTVRYPGSIPGHFQGSHTTPDLLITCVDTAKARRDIFKKFSAFQCGGPRYWLDMGNMKLAGQVILGEPRECKLTRAWQMDSRGFERGFVKGELPQCPLLPHVVDMFPDLLKARVKEDDTPTCSLAEALDRQSLFVNDAVTTYAAQLLDDLLRVGEISVHGYFINLETGIARGIPIPADCATVDPQEPIEARIRVRVAA